MNLPKMAKGIAGVELVGYFPRMKLITVIIINKKAAMHRCATLILLSLLLAFGGCQPPDNPRVVNDDDVVGDDDDAPTIYSFPSRLGDGSDSVAHSGQTFRHVLIQDMKGRIGGMTERLNIDWFPAEGDVVGEMDFYFRFDGDSSAEMLHGITTAPAPLQDTYVDISSGKNLVGKLAGNDAVGQHVDWSTDFFGWGGSASPEALVVDWFGQLEDQVISWSNGDYPKDPGGAPVSSVFITEEGTDLQQLLQKFLLGAVAFSQGADDYLDDDEPGKGLLSDHDAVEDGSNYTALEHAWDEGFGYFGASRDYGMWPDEQIAMLEGRDTVDVDGAVDLTKEVVWGHAQNAAKRDRCADCTAPSDFTKRAWDAFLGGRAYIAGRSGTLSTDEVSELAVFRDEALAAWEETIAATVVHYINDMSTDLEGELTGDGFANTAKHFSEMKGFALALQFNRLSPLTEPEFVELHELLGDAPDLVDPAGYGDDLLAARALLGTAYGFDAGNLVAW